MSTRIAGTGAPSRAARTAGRSLPVLWVLLLLYLASPADVRALEVRAWVDKNEATLEDQILLTLSVTGERRLTGEPVLPPLPDFQVSNGGTSSRTEIRNGQIQSSAERTYVLTPRRTGRFTIGPIRVSRKGHTALTEPIEVHILAASSQTSEAPLAFVAQEVDKDSPFVNQQVLYTFRFFRRVQAMEANWDAPSLQGFWAEDLGKERQYEKVIQGQRYLVTEIRKALFPLAPGTIRIDGTVLSTKLVMPKVRSLGRRGFFDDDFWPDSIFGGRGRTVQKNLHTDPIALTVRALPDAGRPEGFRGLVGTFRVKAEVGDARLHTGDSTTLTVTVSGMGNLRDLEPITPEELPGFKLYPDKPTLDLNTDGDLVHGTKVFRTALVPLEAGTLTVPPQKIVYFDPKAEAYRVEQTSPIALTVEEGANAEPLHLVQGSGMAGTKKTIQVLGKDILPVHTGLGAARSQVLSGVGLWAYTLGLLLPPAAFLGCLVWKRRRERLRNEVHILQRKAARKNARRALKEAHGLMGGSDDAELFRQLARAVKGLVGDKLTLSALACTPAEIHRTLRENGVEEPLADEVRRFLDELEYRQFATAGTQPAEREACVKQAGELVARLDRRL